MITRFRLREIEKFLDLVKDGNSSITNCACEIIIDLLTERKQLVEIARAVGRYYNDVDCKWWFGSFKDAAPSKDIIEALNDWNDIEIDPKDF